MQFKRKLMNQTSEKGKKTNFAPDFDLFAQNLGLQFFPKNLAPPITIYHGVRYISPRTISEKTNNPILRKFSDRRTDRWLDRRTYSRTRVIL